MVAKNNIMEQTKLTLFTLNILYENDAQETVVENGFSLVIVLFEIVHYSRQLTEVWVDNCRSQP